MATTFYPMQDAPDIADTFQEESRRSQARLPKGYNRSVPKQIDGNPEVVMVAIQDSMYAGTPFLGLDQLVFQAQSDHPDWGFTVVELSRNDDDSFTPKVDRKTQDGWQEIDLNSLNEVISHFDPLVIGYTSTSKNVAELTAMLRAIPSSKFRRTVAGGMGISSDREGAVEAYGDAIDLFFDAGRMSPDIFSDLLDDAEHIGGLLGTQRIQDYKRAGEMVEFELSTFDSPSQKLSKIVPASHQRSASWGGKTVYRFKSAEGCGYSCTFCAVGNDYAPRSIDEVREFLDSVVDDMKNKGLSREDVLVFLEDGNLGGDNTTKRREAMQNHAHEMLSLFSGYSLDFGIQVRYDNLSESYLDMLQEGNVNYLYTSVESSNPDVLKKMGKGQKGDVDQIYTTFRSIKERGMKYAISFIRGTEGDTVDTFRQTASLVYALAPDFAFVETAKVYPNTADAVRYERSTGINVSQAYLNGEGLSHGPEFSAEDNGTLLLLTESEAVEAAKVAQGIFCRQEDIVDNALETLTPNPAYDMVRPGFFKLMD